MKHVRGLVLAGCGAWVGAVMVTAGPLNPPPGPVASTFKTLSEIEPRIPIQSLSGDSTALYVINQPGSYYLAGNITGAAGKNGIRVAANNVTLDLRGFVIDGAAVGVRGIAADPALAQLALDVHNGSLSRWTGNGVDAPFCKGCRFEGLQVRANGGVGLQAGVGAIITACVVQGSGAIGIATAENAIVQCCITTGNAGGGISIGDDGSVLQCTSNGNTAPSAAAVAAGVGSSVEVCVARSNAGTGLRSAGGLVRDCAAVSNQTHGIVAYGGVTVQACAASRNVQDGVLATNGDFTANVGTVERCAVTANGTPQLERNGIEVSGAAVIRRNACIANYGIGIYMPSYDTNVVDNLCNANYQGIVLPIVIPGSQYVTFGNFVQGNVVAGSLGSFPLVLGSSLPHYNHFSIPEVLNPPAGFAVPDPRANFVY